MPFTPSSRPSAGPPLDSAWLDRRQGQLNLAGVQALDLASSNVCTVQCNILVCDRLTPLPIARLLHTPSSPHACRLARAAASWRRACQQFEISSWSASAAHSDYIYVFSIMSTKQVSKDYSQPEECLLAGDGDCGGAYIVRLPCGDSTDYLR